MSTYTFEVGTVTWNYTLNESIATIGSTALSGGGRGTAQGTTLNGAITIPPTVGTQNYPVKNIGLMAFYNCSSVTSLVIPDSVTTINQYAFGNCTGLKTITVPDSVINISEYGAFYQCSGLTSVTIGKNVTSIGTHTFYGCTSLTSINIPDSVTSFGTDPLIGTSAYLTVKIKNGKFGFTSPTAPGPDIAFFGNTSVTLVDPSQLTMTITATASGSPLASGSTTKNTPIVLTFTSSASTTDFLGGNIGVINVTNGSLNSSFAGSGTVYTATFTPNGQGVCTINVPANKFTADGLNNNASNTFTFTFDAAPTMTITSTASGSPLANGSTTNVKPIELTFTSSEAIFDFIKEDISFNNGTLSDLTVSNATVRTATFTPTIQGAYTINVPVGTYVDASGNTNAVASTFTFNFDAAPTMVITSTASGSPLANGATTNVKPIELTFTSSEAIFDFIREDISFNNGTLSDITVSSETVRTATFTPTIQGAYTINVPVGAFADASGNSNIAASTFTFNFDAAPTMVITSTTLASGSTSNIASIPLTFTASETITDFAVEDISFNKGTLTEFTGIGTEGTVYTATFTQGGQGEHIINVPVGVYIDASGNANTAASTFTWSYDSVQPNMDISSTTFGVTSGSTTNNETIALTFTSSKPTNNFIKEDISFNRGSLGDLSGSGTVYTATFTPNGQGAHTIYVPVDAYADAVGNNNTASNTFTWTYDSISPSMDISSTTLGVTRGSTTKTTPIDLLFTSTEATTNFALEDISFNNGTLSNFVRISDTVYTARFAPTGPGPVACTIDVLAGAYTDAATNLNNLATQFAFTFDSVVPTMTITSTTAGVVSGSTIDYPTIALTFTSSKATTNFALGDISVTNGTLSAFAASSGTDGKVYTATFTAARQGTCTIGVAAGAYFDAASNNNAASNTFSFGYIPKFAEFIDANNLEQTYIAGFLDVSGTINHRSGDLTVMTGNVIVHAGDAHFTSGNLYVGGNVSVNSNMAVVGTTTLTSLVARDNLDVSGASTLGGSLTVAGITSLNNHVSIANNKQFTVGTGNALFGGDVSLNSNLIVDNGASLKSSADVIGSAVFANTAVNGALLFNTRPSFASDISLNASNVDILGNLYAQYAANSIPASAIVGGAGNVIEADVSMNAGLNIAGATTLSAVATSGGATIGGTLNIIGDATMSTLAISNAATIGGPFNVMGKTAFLNDVSFNGSRIDICGNLYANYPANSIPQYAIIGGGSSTYDTDVSMNAGLFVSNAVNLGSTLVVSGKTAFIGDISLGNVNGSRIDICGNLYANYTANSIPQSAIMGGAGRLFTTDVSINSGLYVKDGITLDTIRMQYQQTPDVGLYVNAALNTTTLSTSGNATLNNTLTVTSATTLSSTLNVTGAATLGSLNVSGATTTAALSTTGAVTFMSTVNLPAWSPFTAAVAGRSTLAVVGATTLKSTLTVTGATTMNSGLSVVGATTMNTTLSGVGATTLAATNAMNILNISGATTLGSTLAVTGATTLASVLTVVGTTRFKGDISMNSTLNVLGDVSLNSTLFVSGATTLPSLTVVGATTMVSTLQVNQTAPFALDVIAGNTLTVANDVSMNTRLSVGGATSFRSTLAVAGATTLAALTTTGNAIIGDGLIVSGVTTFSQDASLNVTNVDISGVVNVGQLTIGQTALQYRPNILQLGGDIDGEASLDQSGRSVSLSADGSIVAIGSHFNDGTVSNSDRGHVRVYQRDATNTTIAPIGWTKLGGDIDGEAASDQSGYSVSLSANGLILAIGGYKNDGTVSNSDRGHVRVYQRDASNNSIAPFGWTKLGGDIDGEAANDYSGRSLSLSADGSILAIGAIFNDGTVSNSDRGHVRVYQRDASNNSIAPIGWTKLGDDIDGEAASDQSGYSVSLSANGLIVAIGAQSNDGSVLNNDRGHVRVYQRDVTNTTIAPIGWTKLGGDIDGETLSDESGYSVSLSADGSILAIGAIKNDGTVSNSDRGHVRVYQRDASNNWTKFGSDIDGEASIDQSGWSVSLSADGSTVAIGANQNDGNAGTSTDNRGHVRIYRLFPTAGLLIDASLNAASIATTGFASVGGNLSVTGATTMSNTLFVTGASTFASLSSINSTTIAGTLNVNGATTIGSTLSVNGAATASSLTTISNTTVGGILNVADATTMAALNFTGQLLQW